MARSTPLSGATPRFDRGLRRVGLDAWAWLQPNGGWGEANAGIIVGEGEALLVDTLWDERLAREMLVAIAQILGGRDLSLVVNTHSDGDHWWGNSALPTGAQIITSARSRLAMEREAGPAELARMAGLARIAARFPSPLRPLSAYVAEMLGPFDFAHTGLRLPDRVFRGREMLSVGGREVHLIEVGPAHTPGDLIVHLPDADLVFAADVLFVDATPVMWFGPLEGWLAAIETMLSLDAAVYVPGHGPPGDRAAVEELRDYLVWVGEAARDQHRLGRSPLETTRAMMSSDEFRRWRAWECPERLLITVATVHRALEGREPIGAAPTARARLFAQIGALRTGLASRGDA